jgi:hypothetical protein
VALHRISQAATVIGDLDVNFGRCVIQRKAYNAMPGMRVAHDVR